MALASTQETEAHAILKLIWAAYYRTCGQWKGGSCQPSKEKTKLYPRKPTINELIMPHKPHEALIINVPWLAAAGATAVSVLDGSSVAGVTITLWVEVEEIFTSFSSDIAVIAGISIQLRPFGASVAWTENVFVAKRDAYAVTVIWHDTDAVLWESISIETDLSEQKSKIYSFCWYPPALWSPS